MKMWDGFLVINTILVLSTVKKSRNERTVEKREWFLNPAQVSCPASA
jgi:hypothetical protein